MTTHDDLAPAEGAGPPTRPGDASDGVVAAARAWYAIHLEQAVDRWLAEVLPVVDEGVTPAFLRARLHGGLRAIVAATTAPPTAASTWIQRDIGRSLATLIADGPAGMHRVRTGLEAALTEGLAAHARAALAERIAGSVSDVVWGFVQQHVRAESAAAAAPTSDRTWYEEMAAQYPFMLVIDDLEAGRTVAGNRHIETMLGYTFEEFCRLADDEVTAAGASDDDYDRGIDLLAGRIDVMERSSRLVHRDGHEVPVDIRIWPLRSPDGQITYIASEFRPAVEEDGDSHWARADKRFRHLARISRDALLIVAADGTIRYASPSTESHLGLDPDEAIGLPLEELAVAADRETLAGFVARLTQASPRATSQVEVRLDRRDGQHRWFEVSGANMLDVPELTGLVVQARDITDRRQLEEMLTRQAMRDPLTGLLNRRGILDHVAAGIARYESTGRPVALIYVDLDDFKGVNDAWGHAAGDQVLVTLTDRLTGVLGDGSVAGRMGGDEFVAIVHDTTPADAAAIAGQIRSALADPVPFEGDTIRVGGSVGFVLTDSQGHSAASLLRAADAALYRAKVARDGQPVLGADPAAR